MLFKKNDTVIFKGNESGIVVIIDDNAEFEEIKKLLRKKAENVKDLFGGSTAPVTFKGKPLMSDEKEELLKIISEKAGLSVSMIAESNPVKEKVEEEIQEELKKRNSEQKKLQSSAKITDLITDIKCLTKYHVGSLRSGMSIEYKGSVIVIGDVNPGAEIRAEGNIIVLGKLKGLAHAGSKGDSSAFIAALSINPTQLRISDVIAIFPSKSKDSAPQYACMEDGRIFLKDL